LFSFFGNQSASKIFASAFINSDVFDILREFEKEAKSRDDH